MNVKKYVCILSLFFAFCSNAMELELGKNREKIEIGSFIELILKNICQLMETIGNRDTIKVKELILNELTGNEVDLKSPIGAHGNNILYFVFGVLKEYTRPGYENNEGRLKHLTNYITTHGRELVTMLPRKQPIIEKPIDITVAASLMFPNNVLVTDTKVTGNMEVKVIPTQSAPTGQSTTGNTASPTNNVPTNNPLSHLPTQNPSKPSFSFDEKDVIAGRNKHNTSITLVDVEQEFSNWYDNIIKLGHVCHLGELDIVVRERAMLVNNGARTPGIYIRLDKTGRHWYAHNNRTADDCHKTDEDRKKFLADTLDKFVDVYRKLKR